MKTKSQLAVTFTIGIVIGASALAFANGQSLHASVDRDAIMASTEPPSEDLCVPMACSIVSKTDPGGPPSEIRTLQ